VALRSKLLMSATASEAEVAGGESDIAVSLKVLGSTAEAAQVALSARHDSFSDTSSVSFARPNLSAARDAFDTAEVQSRIASGLKLLTMAKDYHSTTRTTYRKMIKRFGQDSIAKLQLDGSCLGARASQAVQSTAFNAMTAAFIVLNAILIGVSSDFDVRCAVLHDFACTREPSRLFAYFNTFFTMVFTLELLLRIGTRGLAFYCSNGWELNMMDTVVVALSLFEEVVGGYRGVDFMYVRLLRLSRLVRTLRVFQSLPFFHTLRTMLNTILDCAGYLLWAMVLLWFVMFMFAVAFMQGVSQHAESDMATEEETVVMETYFPSLEMTLLTLFMSISGGLNWWEIIQLFLHINPLFGFYISLMVLALLNIVTGIFVNDALEQSQLDRDLMAKLELERRQRDMERLRMVFAAVDVEETGKITLDQFLVYMDMKEVKALFSVMGLDISDAISFFEALDVDGSHDLVIEEFVMGCMNLRGSANRAREQDWNGKDHEVRPTSREQDIHLTVFSVPRRKIWAPGWRQDCQDSHKEGDRRRSWCGFPNARRN